MLERADLPSPAADETSGTATHGRERWNASGGQQPREKFI